MAGHEAYLFAYFKGEQDAKGEQVYFAVSNGPAPTSWTELNGGGPALISKVGECGVRDPFIIRDENRGRLVLLATDLRIWPDGDWHRSVRHGSRSILVWESEDLVTWSEGRLAEISGTEAGNTWAPKAFWSEEKGVWLVFWASALYGQGERESGQHQRMMWAETKDFSTFSEPNIYLDPGHDVIDATLIMDGDAWFRFSANAHVPGGSPELGNHIFHERGKAIFDQDYASVAVDVGKPELRRGEGPAVVPALDRPGWYLLIDEFGLRGYQLFQAQSLRSGKWQWQKDAGMPVGARHGSLLPITSGERRRIVQGSLLTS
ncbi:glycoside hydrolase family 43 protein [Arthrobacter sp. ISL-30]|uniref:glycoside hydrolase family 43 protein n=1 Tax=Arthrobacter sp. ISL-30 TaxID=2819109 RepID=UPI001BEBD4C2|nr:glycoside hydrolase family 43 protein [Arthrobacter sp. ISL-30]MBT2511999.1 glycoside hydrolase family 43 protein [Arthrobacter sp. ISL-30]